MALFGRNRWVSDLATSVVTALMESVVVYHILVNSKPFRETTLNGEPVFKMLAEATILVMPIIAASLALALAKDHAFARPMTAALIGPLVVLLLFTVMTPSLDAVSRWSASVDEDAIVKTSREKLIEARSEFLTKIIPVTAMGLLFAVVAASPLYIVRRRRRMRTADSALAASSHPTS